MYKGKRYRKLSEEEQDKVMVLFSQGVARKYIAERFGITHTAVCHIIKRRKEREKNNEKI